MLKIIKLAESRLLRGVIVKNNCQVHIIGNISPSSIKITEIASQKYATFSVAIGSKDNQPIWYSLISSETKIIDTLEQLKNQDQGFKVQVLGFLSTKRVVDSTGESKYYNNINVVYLTTAKSSYLPTATIKIYGQVVQVKRINYNHKILVTYTIKTYHNNEERIYKVYVRNPLVQAKVECSLKVEDLIYLKTRLTKGNNILISLDAILEVLRPDGDYDIINLQDRLNDALVEQVVAPTLTRLTGEKYLCFIVMEKQPAPREV